MTMEDITANMLRFKEATRHLWNTYLLQSMSPLREGSDLRRTAGVA